VSPDPELDGIARLATQLSGALAAISLADQVVPVLGATGSASCAIPLRGTDGVVRGALTVDAAALDERQRQVVDVLAAQAGAVLERREREAGLLDTVGELLRSNDELTAFAGRVAHDLRAPLTAVLGFLQLADGPFRDETSARAADCIGSALGAATRMRTLIDDLLGYATFDARPQLADVDLPGMIAALSEDLADEIAAVAGEVAYEGPEHVRSDVTLLRQLLQNLIGNALKHGRPGVAPRVRIRASAVGDVWTLEVADNGPGVPADQRERVFDPFVRLTGGYGARGTVGSGIGLSTCARIAEAFGGTISVADAEWPEGSGGAAFRVTLPWVA
jgi:signal transduction histidine kinase